MDQHDEETRHHYSLVAQAIEYIRTHSVRQPSLPEIAHHVGLSDTHFQRVFSQWAGVSPKRFLQYLTKEHALQALRASSDVLGASLSAGLSAPSRLHDLIISCEAVTPGEVKSRGAGVAITYGHAETPFGNALIGWTSRGICHFEFCSEIAAGEPDFIGSCWANAVVGRDDHRALAIAALIFPSTPGRGQLHVVLRGTNFQIKVWEALLRTKPAQIVSYTQLAALAGMPKAQRAVGSALAANAVGYLIPCHRVIREGGEIGSYRWGSTRKAALLAWEAARMNQDV